MGRGMANRHPGSVDPNRRDDQSPSFDRNPRCRRFTHRDPSNSYVSVRCSALPSASVVRATHQKERYLCQSIDVTS
jgi:hypothetical protein